jgi:hypothetical protein
MRRVYTLLYIWLTNAFDRDIWPNTKLFRKRNSQSDAASTCTCTDTSATQQPAVPVDEQDDVGAIIMDLINEIQQVLPEGSNQLKLALIRVCRSSRALSRVISSTLNRLLSLSLSLLLSRCCSLVLSFSCYLCVAQQNVKAMRSAKRATIENAELLWNLEAQVEPLELLSQAPASPKPSRGMKRRVSLISLFRSKRKGSMPRDGPSGLTRTSSVEDTVELMTRGRADSLATRRSSSPSIISDSPTILAPPKNEGSGFAAGLPSMLHKPPGQPSALPKFGAALVAPGM